MTDEINPLEVIDFQVKIGEDGEKPGDWYVRTVATRLTGEVLHDDIVGPFPSEDAAKEAADDLIGMMNEVTGKNGSLYDRFIAIAHSDRAPGDQLIAVRDLLKPIMLANFHMSMREKRMVLNPQLADLFGQKDFHDWCNRDGIKQHVKQAFLDMGKDLKG